MTRTFVIEPKKFPELPKLMLATLNALRDLGGSASLHELDERIIELEGVSEEEQAYTMPDGETLKLKYYLSWARTYLKRGGALENSARGVWGLTDLGETIHSVVATEAIYRQVNEEEKQRAKEKRAAKKQEAEAKAERKLLRESSVILPETISPEINADEDDTISDDWKDDLLAILKAMDPAAFERLSQRLLREAGFTKVEVRGKTGDGGIDGVGVLRVNLVSFQVYFQCKRYKGSVGSKEIRDFRGALMGRADKGLFITTGTFTSQASDEATRDGATAIDLIDGDRLCDLLKQYDLGVS
ncbi:MAG TPA: restriction endonuclease, partial [Hyphomonas sp.]|nr:restriction endonuclease [Hyphomonas sp.]